MTGASRLLGPQEMLAGYAQGIFPMAEARGSEVLHWVDPRFRGIMPLDKFHISRSLARRIRRENYEIRTNSAFLDVVDLCAARPETWINAALRDLYGRLHAMGFAHSLEVVQEGALTGGVFGIALGGAFFGESMFSTRTDASKIALAYLVERLARGGFRLFDVQFMTDHLASLGAVEIPRARYRALLAEALALDADFDPGPADAYSVLQRSTQTS